MAITQFIKDLLYTGDQLILPGFGGFVAQYMSTQVDKDNKTIYPPAKHFTFDPSLTRDDDRLAQYVSVKQMITASEAKKAVEEMVADFWKRLQEGSTLMIEEVGYFSLDDENKIRFQKEANREFNADSFGLPPLSFEAEDGPDSYEEEYIPPPKRISVARILIIFLILNVIGALSALVYWKFDFFHPGSKPVVQNEIPAVMEDTTEAAATPDTNQLAQSIDTMTNRKNALHYEEPVVADTVKGENTDAKYYIIAASFQSYDKAQLHLKMLKKKGLNPEVIEFSQQLFRVSIGEYANKEEASRQLEQFKGKKETEGAWILLK